MKHLLYLVNVIKDLSVELLYFVKVHPFKDIPIKSSHILLPHLSPHHIIIKAGISRITNEEHVQ